MKTLSVLFLWMALSSTFLALIWRFVGSYLQMTAELDVLKSMEWHLLVIIFWLAALTTRHFSNN